MTQTNSETTDQKDQEKTEMIFWTGLNLSGPETIIRNVADRIKQNSLITESKTIIESSTLLGLDIKSQVQLEINDFLTLSIEYPEVSILCIQTDQTIYPSFTADDIQNGCFKARKTFDGPFLSSPNQNRFQSVILYTRSEENHRIIKIVRGDQSIMQCQWRHHRNTNWYSLRTPENNLFLLNTAGDEIILIRKTEEQIIKYHKIDTGGSHLWTTIEHLPKFIKSHPDLSIALHELQNEHPI